MPHEISDEEFNDFQRLRSDNTTLSLDLLKANFRAENPHVPAALLESWSGETDSFKGYADALKGQFPAQQPVAPPAQAAPVADPAAAALNPAAPAAAPVAPPAPPAGLPQLPQLPPGPSVPPVMATNFPAPVTPDAARLAAHQAMAVGMPPPTLEQSAAALGRIPGASAPGALPVPGAVDALSQENLLESRSEQIREQMRMGVARPADVLWLSQFGTKGFTSAMRTHGARVLASRGGVR